MATACIALCCVKDKKECNVGVMVYWEYKYKPYKADLSLQIKTLCGTYYTTVRQVA